MNPEQPNARIHPTVSGRQEEGLVSGERLRLLVLGAITLIFLVLCAVLAVPFLPALTWGLALAIVAWPLQLWVHRRISGAGLAAGVTLAVVVVAILVPGIYVGYQLVNEASSVAERVKNQQVQGTLRDTLEKAPGMQGTVNWLDRMNIDLDAEVHKLIGSFTQDLSGLVRGSLTAVIQLAMALFILFYLLRDRPAIMGGVRGLMPLSRPETDRVFHRIADSVHATVYGQVVTSVINGVTGGLLFWAVGLPSPVLWGVVMAVLSILPVLGTFIIWMPATVYLFVSGNPLGATALVAWGVTMAVLVDNVLLARLVGGRMRMHEVPMFIALLGGVAVFGISGMIIGPVIAATTLGLLDVWRKRSDEEVSDVIVRRLEKAADEPEEAMAESDAAAAEDEAKATDPVVEKMEKAAVPADGDPGESMPRGPADAAKHAAEPKPAARTRSRK